MKLFLWSDGGVNNPIFMRKSDGKELTKDEVYQEIMRIDPDLKKDWGVASNLEPLLERMADDRS